MQINVTEYLDKTAQLFPNKIAIDDLNKSLTFSQLRRQALSLARIIIEQDIKNSPIAVYIQKNCDAAVGFAAINYSGNFYVPIDMKSPESRIKNIFDSLHSKVIITNKANYDNLKSFFDGKIILVEDSENTSARHSEGETRSNPEPLIRSQLAQIIDTDPVYSIFTSGSTGNPKGVVISHRGVIDYVDWVISTFNPNENTIIANQTPFYFDMSVIDLYLMFGVGATLIIVPDEYFVFPAKLIDLMNEKKVNFIFWVPFMFINIANYKLFEQKKPEYLEKILFAGEVMPNKHLNYWRKHLPDCLYADLYGPTEITVTSTCYIVDREFSDEEPLPIGKPRRNAEILILTDDNRKAQVNERGELCIRGTSLAMGYFDDPEKTAKVFVQNPLNPHFSEIIYRTGDLAYWNERGEVMYVGRKDSQIKHNGYRIELGDIENAVLGTELVDAACVIYDYNSKEIVLFYLAEREISAGEFRRNVMQFIPKYMAPTKYHRLDKFPLNANGKVDRLKLSEVIDAKI